MVRYDAIVVGAGPAGSTAAYHLARAGASVLLLDRARFPRDKPCGGALSYRTVRLLPFPVDPVVEDVVDRVEFRLRYGRRVERRSKGPLIVMTRRRKLDAFLADRAVDAGAEFRDGARVTALDAAGTRTTVGLGRERLTASVVVGADGVNGTSARALRVDRARVQTVALEGNAALTPAREGRYRGRIVIELATVPGGYGWVFAKDDHLNVGVWGWESEGPSLRARLTQLCREHRLDPAGLRDLRGYRLPLRWRNATLTAGRAVLVGDAAGLVDPFTGDGIFEAVLSATLASQAALALLVGGTASLAPYEDRLVSSLEPLATASWRIKLAFDRFPSLGFALARAPLAWWLGERVLRGELADPRPSSARALLSQRTLALLAARRSRGDGGDPVGYGT